MVPFDFSWQSVDPNINNFGPVRHSFDGVLERVFLFRDGHKLYRNVPIMSWTLGIGLGLEIGVISGLVWWDLWLVTPTNKLMPVKTTANSHILEPPWEY